MFVFPPFGEIVVSQLYRKTCINLIFVCLRFSSSYIRLSVRFTLHLLYLVFNDHKAFSTLLVGSSGLEPPTSRLSGARSNHLSYEPIQYRGVSSLHLFASGGDDGIRTHDPLLAGQVLSQLSYTPISLLLRPLGLYSLF